MKINVTNTEKLSAAIKEAEYRVSARTITADEIQKEVKLIESKLSLILAKKDWVGVVLHIDLNAQSFPSAYRGAPESTQFRLERFSSGWFVTGLGRHRCQGSRKNELTLTESQKEKLAEYIQTNF